MGEPRCDWSEPDDPGHCWHRTGAMLMTHPPQWDEVCCHCGTQKRVHHGNHPSAPTGHGPHLPGR